LPDSVGGGWRLPAHGHKFHECACGGAAVAREASEEDLLDRYNVLARGLKSMDATLEMKATAGTKYSGVIDQYHEVKTFLLASRPYNVRMIGQVPVVGKTVFDMVSDGQTFEVSIRQKNNF